MAGGIVRTPGALCRACGFPTAEVSYCSHECARMFRSFEPTPARRTTVTSYPIECSQCDYVADSKYSDADSRAYLDLHMLRYHMNPYPTPEAIQSAWRVNPPFRDGVEAVLIQLEILRDEWLAEPSSSSLLNSQAAMRLMHVIHDCRGRQES